MTLAETKRKENIVEFILFTWQMVDLIRATDFNRATFLGFIKSPEMSEDRITEEMGWYDHMVDQIRKEKIEKGGSLNEIRELISELSLIHNNVLNVVKDKQYIDAYAKASPNLQEFQSRTPGNSDDVELCLTALYGLLVLRLKKQKVGQSTLLAMASFSELMSLLAAHYRNMQEGESDYNLN